MQMRIRLPELLAGRSAYSLAKSSGGRVSMSTAYRLVKLRGRVQTFDGEMCEALCDVLGVELGQLFERDKDAAPSRRKRKR